MLYRCNLNHLITYFMFQFFYLIDVKILKKIILYKL